MSARSNSYPFVRGSLVDVDHVRVLARRYPMYEQAVAWLEDFIAKPHPNINRSGHVCPGVAPALRQNLIWLVAIRTDGSSAEEAFEKGLHLADLYEELFADAKQRDAGALLAFFPNLDPANIASFIDGGHRLLRMEFVRRGLMIGALQPASEYGSLRNSNFKVMRSPVPMLAVRALSAHDFSFLDRPDMQTTDRLRCLEYYLAHLGGRINPHIRQRVATRVAAIAESLRA